MPSLEAMHQPQCRSEMIGEQGSPSIEPWYLLATRRDACLGCYKYTVCFERVSGTKLPRAQDCSHRHLSQPKRNLIILDSADKARSNRMCGLLSVSGVSYRNNTGYVAGPGRFQARQGCQRRLTSRPISKKRQYRPFAQDGNALT